MQIADSSIDVVAIKAVAFDCFGTLLEISDKCQPYKRLLELLQTKGHLPAKEDAERIMRANTDVSGVPGLFGLELSATEIDSVERFLSGELQSIRRFEDTCQSLSTLAENGYKIALCSNFAKPYAAPARALLVGMDAYLRSFEQGYVKPEPGMYQAVCVALQCKPSEILMVGDSWRNDVEGARAYGLQALWLDRSGKTKGSIRGLSELVRMLTNSAEKK